MQSKPNYQDLVTWTLSNDDIPESAEVYIDALHDARRLTKAHVRSYVRRLAAGLRHENAGLFLDGHVVCLHAFNDIFYPVLLLGIVGAGGVFTGTNPAYTTNELAHHFQTSSTYFILTEPDHLPRVLEAAQVCSIPASRVFTFNPRDQAASPALRSWTDLLQHGETGWVDFCDEQKSKTTTAALFSTSGTTGLPKMAIRSHYSMVAESRANYGLTQKPHMSSRLISMPFFHAFASPLANIDAVRNGVPTYVMPRFSEKNFLATILRHQITETAFVPPILVGLLSGHVETHRHALQSLRVIWCGGAPLDPHIQQRALTQLFDPAAQIDQVWGMTECGWISTFFYPEIDTSGSVGRCLPGFDFKLIDDDGSTIANTSNRGEVWVRGPSIMNGYLNNAAATAATISDGWLCTGDVGSIIDGKVYIVDRKKELIKTRGWQVAPAELEGTLLLHDAIADAAVIGVLVDKLAGTEIPRAYVIRRKGVDVSAAEIKAFLLKHLAKYKVAECEICFCQSIPKSPSGKILRRLLRDAANEQAPGEITSLELAPEEDIASGFVMSSVILLWRRLRHHLYICGTSLRYMFFSLIGSKWI